MTAGRETEVYPWANSRQGLSKPFQMPSCNLHRVDHLTELGYVHLRDHSLKYL